MKSLGDERLTVEEIPARLAEVRPDDAALVGDDVGRGDGGASAGGVPGAGRGCCR